MQKSLTCIICPRGCSLNVTMNGNEILVEGQSCPRGKTYAEDECTHPMRTVTSSIRVKNKPNTMVSVRTSAPIEKDKIFDAMSIIRKAEAVTPIHIGDVLIPDVFGADIIATKEIL